MNNNKSDVIVKSDSVYNREAQIVSYRNVTNHFEL